MEKNKIGVYKIINKKNDKVYVGSTSKCFYLRFKQHFNNLKNGKHENPILQKSYDKHGLESFNFEIIETFNEISVEELLKLESFYINEYHSNDRKFGYNICNVGQSRLGTKWSEESKNKRCGEGNPMFGKGYTKMGDKNPMFGKNVSEETRNKISLINKGCKKPMISEILGKPIFQIDKNGNVINEYKSITEAMLITNIKHIGCVCNGKRKTAGGFKWKFKNE